MITDLDSEKASRVILDIQRAFVELITSHFSDLWQFYDDGDLVVQQAVAHYLNAPSKIVVPGLSGVTTSLFRRIEDLLVDIDIFWTQYADALRDAVSHSNGFGVLVGDIDAVSDYYVNRVIQLGLYFDTVYLLDPLSVAAQRVKREPEHLTGNQHTQTVIRVLCGLLDVRELLDELPPKQFPPVVAFVPILGMQWGDTVFDRIFEVATKHTNLLLSGIFGQDIQKPADFLESTQPLSMEQFDARLRSNPVGASLLERFPSFDAYIFNMRLWHNSKESDYLRARIGDSVDKGFVYSDIQATMLSLESAEVFATSLTIDAATGADNHMANVHRVQSNQECGHRLGLREGEVAAHALLGGELNWLLPETLPQLLYCREANLLEGIRDLFRVGRRILQQAAPSERQAAAEVMVASVHEGLQRALAQFEENRQLGVKNLALRSLQFTGSIGLGVLTTIFNLPLFASVPITALIPSLTVWDVSQTEKETLKREQALLKQPAFILLNMAKAKELDRTLPLSPEGHLPSETFLRSLS